MLQPIGNKILVKPILRHQEGSIHLPEGLQQNKGLVLGIGNRVKHVKVGDTIVHERMEAYDPGKVEVDGELHFLMAEERVVGVVE